MSKDYERTTIIPGYGFTGSFTANSGGTVEYELIVRSGSGVSFYLVDRNELQNYERGFNFGSYTRATHKNVMSVQNAHPIEAGDYGLIVENPTFSNVVVDLHIELPISGDVNLS
jgi:hypothetical protein